MHERVRLLNAANALTGVRLAAAPALAAAIAGGAYAPAAALFAIAIATDFADGAVARRRGESTRLGGFLDHATDALFVTCGLAALAAGGQLTAVLPVLVAVAFTQYALDSRVAAGGALRGSALGRWNGIAYYVMLGIPVIRDALGLAWPPGGLVAALAWALVASTLVSIAARLGAGRRSPPRA
jgi:phosphatidylglycerophosphate synthase